MIFAGVCEVRRHNMCVFQDGHNVRLGHHVALKSCRDLAKRCQPTCWTNLAVFYYGKPLKSRTCSFSRVSSRKELLMLSCSMFLRHSHHADHLDYAVLCQCWLTLSCNWRCVSVAWKPLKLSMHGSSLTKWFAKFHNIHDVWRWWMERPRYRFTRCTSCHTTWEESKRVFPSQPCEVCYKHKTTICHPWHTFYVACIRHIFCTFTVVFVRI